MTQSDALGSVGSPGLRYVSEKTILELHKDIAKVKLFTTDFSDETLNAGGSLLLPYFINGTANNFDRSTNNYSHYDGVIKFISVGLNNHIKHSFKFSEKKAQMLPKGANKSLLLKSATSSADAIGRRIARIVGGLINSTNIPTSGTDTTTFVNEDGETIETKSTLSFSSANEYVVSDTTFTKKTAATLRAAATSADISFRGTVLALRPEKFVELLADLEANVYGGVEAVREGVIPSLFGFKAVIEMDELSDTNLIGALIPETAIGICSRYIEPEDPELYRDVGASTDPDSGLTLGWRRGGDWTTGDTVATAECLFGAKLLQPTKIVRIVSEASENSAKTAEVGPTGETGETGATA